MHRIGLVSVLSIALSGCAGPMKLSRKLDEHYNQFYVDSPFVTQLTTPIVVTGGVVASTLDYGLVNPVFWWKDAVRGRGTPFYYKNPEVPAEE